MRAATAWDLDVNPGRFSDGKFLLFYYLGLFEADPTTALFVSRTAIALFSLISGSVVYLLARWLHCHISGLLALAIYVALPFTFFHERMALADPFAAGFGCLVAWRSLVFARHPRWRDGVILGGLLALSTMAKLTSGSLPILPVLASVVYFAAIGHIRGQNEVVIRCYLPPLALAATV
jgi:hypothetical protein